MVRSNSAVKYNLDRRFDSSVPEIQFEREWPLAGFWLRACAYLWDLFLLITPVLIITAIAKVAWISLVANSAQSFVTVLITTVIGSCIPALIFATFESSPLRGTPGKWMMGLVVTNDSREPISFWGAFARNLLKVISNFTLGIGYLLAAFTTRKQALHDILSYSLVVQNPRVSNWFRLAMALLVLVLSAVVGTYVVSHIR